MESLDLSAFFITKAQATDVMLRIASVSDKVFTTNFTLEKTLAELFGIQKKDLLLKLFREHNISETSPSDIQAFLKKIQDTIKTLPVITLSIAFEPTEEILKSFSEWFLFTLKKQVVFALEIDITILAGARITCNGKFKDYSVTPLFTKLMNTALVATPPQGITAPSTLTIPTTTPTQPEHNIL